MKKLNLDDFINKNNKSEKLLGINIDNNLTFNEHVSKLFKSASQKLHAVACISSYLSKNKFVCLVWMFHNRRHNYKINCLHKRMLRII